MADKESQSPGPAESKPTPAQFGAWSPMTSLRREVDRLFDDFDRDLWSPLRRSVLGRDPWRASPSVDVAEKDDRYEIRAELPGLDEKDVEVSLVNGGLTIKGEKREEKEEKKVDYYLQERRFGSFERRFPLPEHVDAEKIEARFDKGVLTVVLPKTAEAQQPAKRIEVKSA